MAFTTAVVRGTVGTTTSSVASFTKAGFGTPSAAIITWCYGNNTANPANGEKIGVGFWDGTNQRAVGVEGQSGSTTSNTCVSVSDVRGMIVPHLANAVNANFTVASVTDGISLTLVTGSAGFFPTFVTVLLLGGISAKALSITPNAAVDGTTVSASLGFAPKLVFFANGNNTTATDSMVSHARLSFGFAAIDGTQRSYSNYWRDNNLGEVMGLHFSETRCTEQLVSGSPPTLGSAGEVTTWGADTFTLTTRDAAPGTRVWFALALGGADFNASCGTLDSRLTSGNDVVTTAVNPLALLTCFGTAPTTLLQTSANASGLMLGLADNDGEFCHNVAGEPGATTCYSRSTAHATQCVDLNDINPSATVRHLLDATATLGTGQFTLNYTAVSVSVQYKGFYVAFGTAAALVKKYSIPTNAPDGTQLRLWIYTDTTAATALVSNQLVTASGGFFKYTDPAAVVGVSRPASLLSWGANSSAQAFGASCWAVGIEE